MKLQGILAAAAALALLPLSARADLYCPQQESLFGTVTSVSRHSMTLRTTSSIGSIHVHMHRPQIDAHGMALRPGVFAGVYGCLAPNRQNFDADQITLASSADAYNGYSPRRVLLSGRVTQIGDGRVLLASDGGHGNVWVRTQRRNLRVGEFVQARGWFTPRDGSFLASGITRVR